MFSKSFWGMAAAGLAAGFVAGLWGAGGGMVLVPLLSMATALTEEEIFPASISIILPICLVSLFLISLNGSLPWKAAVPYLLGSTIGGTLAGFWGKRIPVLWLHRILGGLILWGGVLYLW